MRDAARVGQGAPYVTLRRCGATVQVEPASEEVRRALRTAVHVAHQVPGGGLRVFAAPLPVYRERPWADGPALCLPAGLGPVAREALRRAGCRIEDRGQAPPPLPPPDLTRLEGLGAVDRTLLDAVRRHDRALLRHGPGIDPALLVAQVARAWPGLTVTVPVARRADAWRLGRALRGLLPDVSVVTGQGGPAEVGRVVVATFTALGHTARYRLPGYRMFDISWTDILVVPDALSATATVARGWLGHAARARVYGLLPLGAKPSPLQEDLLRAVLGFEEAVLPRHGHCERPVLVLGHRFTGGVPLPPGLAGVALQRRGVWQHPIRNRIATRLAAACAAGTAQAVLGPAAAGITPGAVVLAANAEHALALAARLPEDWLLLASDVHEEGLTPEQVRRLHRPVSPFRAGPLYAVATPAVLPNLDLSCAGVLVRADGGVGPPPLAIEQLAEPDDGPARPLLLVDLDDRHHPTLRRRARLRRQAYAVRGWFAPGTDPVQARVEQFLATRPAEGHR
jgi:hypothetical protein